MNTQNNRYLHFKSNYHPKDKTAVIIYLVNRTLNICLDSYIIAELDFIRDILFGNGFSVLFINNTVKRIVKRNSRKIDDNLPFEPQNIICLPYIPKITRNLKKVCTQNNFNVIFTNNLKIINFLICCKDETPVTRQRVVYQLQYSIYGKFYLGWTHQNFEKRLQQHIDITTALNSNIASVSFHSALSSHVFENPSHKILFEEFSLNSNDLGIKQVVREAIEIRLKINNNISLNSDLGEYSLNALYKNLIKNDLTKFYTIPIDINTESAAYRLMRSAAKKARLALKTYF